MWYETSVVSFSWLNFNEFIVIAFPVVLAIAHAIALTSGHPKEYTLFKPSSRYRLLNTEPEIFMFTRSVSGFISISFAS